MSSHHTKGGHAPPYPHPSPIWTTPHQTNSVEHAGSPVTRVEDIEGIPDLWNETLGDPNICIAVLDGAVDLRHPSLIGKKDLIQIDRTSRRPIVDLPPTFHGTHIASVIFGQHDSPIRGIAPRCRGLIVPIYEGQGDEISCSQGDLATAIRMAVDEGADVINVSGGERSEDGSASEDLRAAIHYCCVERGRLLVAAAGNEGCEECLHVPAAIPAVLVAGAMDAREQPHRSSNYGEIYRLQGVVAPGENILGAQPGGGVVAATGTSFATPIVAGVTGLLLSLQRAWGQTPNPLVVREAILQSARGCGLQDVAVCDRLLGGRLDIRRARTFLLRGISPMADNIELRSDAQAPPAPAQAPPAPGQAPPAPAQGPPPAAHQPASTYPSWPTGPGPYQPAAVYPGGSSYQAAVPYPTAPEGPSVFPQMEQHRPVVPPPLYQSPPPYQHLSPPPYQSPPYRPVTPPYGMAPSGYEVQSITPSGCGCGCQGKGQKVFAVGELDVDFITQTRMDSLQDNFGALPIQIPEHLLGYLLGLTGRGELLGLNNGNLFDAASIYWVLKQGECPLYVVQPQGPYAEAAYKQIIVFFIEQLISPPDDRTIADALDQLGISTGCIEGFFPCFGGSQYNLHGEFPAGEKPEHKPGGPAPEEPKPSGEGEAEREEGATQEEPAQGVLYTASAIFDEEPRRAAHIAIAGEIVGRARLYSGEEVEVINPAMRGMQNWNTVKLIDAVRAELRRLYPRILTPAFEDRLTVMLLKLVASLYEAVRNPGKDPRDRAKNYFATKRLFLAGTTLVNRVFLSMLGAFGPPPTPQGQRPGPDTIDDRQFVNIAIDKLTANNARCARINTEPYDVELSFYNFANQFMGTAVLAQTVDVSDIVPVSTGASRVFQRRGV